MSLPWETSKGRQGGEWLHSPLSFASPSPQGAALNPKPHTGNKPQGDGVLLQELCLPSSKSAQGASPHLGPHPSPCLQTLAGGTYRHQGQLLHQLEQAFFDLSKQAVQPFLNVYLLLRTEGNSPPGPQKDLPCHLLSSSSILKSSMSPPICS